MAYEITLLTTMAIAILFALSLNVITGFCGQVSLGHAAFFGIGAYTAAMLTKQGVPLAERSDRACATCLDSGVSTSSPNQYSNRSPRM